jgi:hypothetical protein
VIAIAFYAGQKEAFHAILMPQFPLPALSNPVDKPGLYHSTI